MPRSFGGRQHKLRGAVGQLLVTEIDVSLVDIDRLVPACGHDNRTRNVQCFPPRDRGPTNIVRYCVENSRLARSPQRSCR